MNDLKHFIETLFPLNRSICSPGLDEALSRIKELFLPKLVIESYPTGSDVWTWTLPRKWDLHEGYIKQDGKTIIHTRNEPLCVWSGSLPVDKKVSYRELIRHLYSDPSRPNLLCWYFKYYGTLDWGFNIPHSLVDKLDKKSSYQVKIDARYYDDNLKIGFAKITGKSEKTILITSDICHPFQCNDSITGAAVANELYKHLEKKCTNFSYLFTFVPETIGTIAFLANNEGLIPKIAYHIYTEFWGSKGNICLHSSLRGDSSIDRIAKETLKDLCGSNFKVVPFHVSGLINDELVTSMPNIFIPSIALNRGRFSEYHSNQDTPDRLNYKNISEGVSIMKNMIDRLEKNFTHIDCDKDRGSIKLTTKKTSDEFEDSGLTPVPLFKGPVFLSKYDLWVDWRKDRELNTATDLIMSCMDGKNSIRDIARFLNLPYEKVLQFIKRFEKEGLVQIKQRELARL